MTDAAAPTRPALAGREAELGRLRSAWDAAAGGTPGVVLVAGEAGIGKSRLAAELASTVSASGGRALIGGCLDLADGGLPLLPLAEALRSLARDVPWSDLERILGPLRAQLAGILPGLTDEPPATDEPLAPARMSEAVLAILGRLSADRPTMLAFEDVHWIDRASRDLVTFLSRNLSREPLLLVLTCRTDDLDPDTEHWLAELGRQPRVDRMDLARLDRAAVRAQLAALRGGEPDPREVDRAWRRSDGNPYFVEELATAPDIAAPSSLVALLTARLSVLGEATRGVVRIAALAARSMDEALLVAAAERPATEVRTAIREAVARRVLAVDAEGRIGFRHALLREVAAGELLAGERRELHERLASVLAERTELAEPSPAGATAELAHHWEAAGRRGEALTAAIEAGAAAARVAAWADADRQYERALRLAEDAALPDGLDPVELLRRAAEAAELSGDVPRAERLVERALETADASAEPERTALLHSRHGYFRWVAGDDEGSLAAYERGLALLPKQPPSAARARILGSKASALLGLGRYDDGRAAANEAVAAAQAARARSEEGRARNVLGSLLVAQGDVATGIAELRRSAELATEAGPSDMRVIGPYNLAVNLAMAGRLAEAQEAARQGIDAAKAEGLLRRYGMDLAALEGDVLTRLGRWTDAAAVLGAGVALDPSGRGTIYLATALGRLDALRGDTGAAARRFTDADELAEGRMDADLAGFLARARAEAALVDGDPAAALDAALDGLAPLEGSDDHFVRSPLVVIAVGAAAELRDAKARVEHLLTELQEAPSAAPVASALRTHLDAETSRLRGLSDPAAWAQVADAYAAIPDPYGAACAKLRLAEALLVRDGIKADVAAPLREAAATARELGATPLLRDVEALARKARVGLEAASEAQQTTQKATRDRAGLSAREREVLRLVADGRSNGEIGQALFISRKTAGVHVTHILDKLGVANRVEAAMAASRLGLLEEPADQ